MIRTTRERRKITQKELALRCNLSQGYLSKLETKEYISYNPTIRQVAAIANELKISPSRLAKWFIEKELKQECELELSERNE